MADVIDPSAASGDYDRQVDFWNMVDAILGGETRIKAGGVAYLPKFKNEKQATYDYRLQASPFTNIYSDISKNLAAKPFSKPVVMADGTPERFETLAENVDGQGNNQHVFAANAFKSALDYSISWILVDYTKAQPRTDGLPLTRADEAEQGLRPYWVNISAKRMKAVYSVFLAGVETIYHARFEEFSKELSGFNESTVTRIREFNRDLIRDELGNVIGLGPAMWRVWQQTVGADQSSSWTIIGEGAITIGVIPLVPVVLTARDGGSWVAEPALRDLAHMQLTEYRQESNLEWVKIMTCFPMVCVSGMDVKNADGSNVEVTVGPNTTFLIPQNSQGTGPAGTVSIVEPSSQSIVENRNQLELTRKEMRDLGMQPLAEANLTVVTTANVSKKASSAVQAWAFKYQDALESAWKLTAKWLGDSAEPEVVIFTDFAIETDGDKRREAVLKAEAQSIISKRTARDELKRDDTLKSDVTNEQEEQRLAEQQQGMEPEEAIDPVTGQPFDPMQHERQPALN